MTAEIKLTETEIVEACMAYVRSHGWAVAGRGAIRIQKGCIDPRDGKGEPDRAEFVCQLKAIRESLGDK